MQEATTQLMYVSLPLFLPHFLSLKIKSNLKKNRFAFQFPEKCCSPACGWDAGAHFPAWFPRGSLLDSQGGTGTPGTHSPLCSGHAVTILTDLRASSLRASPKGRATSVSLTAASPQHSIQVCWEQAGQVPGSCPQGFIGTRTEHLPIAPLDSFAGW